MKGIIPFITTSLIKNPEEWVFIAQARSNDPDDDSTLNLFRHEPTNYALILLELPGEDETKFLCQIMSRDEYNEILGDNDGSLTPNEDLLVEISSGSSIVKTLKFIKEISQEDDNIFRYSDFTEYVKDKQKIGNPDGENTDNTV